MNKKLEAGEVLAAVKAAEEGGLDALKLYGMVRGPPLPPSSLILAPVATFALVVSALLLIPGGSLQPVLSFHWPLYPTNPQVGIPGEDPLDVDATIDMLQTLRGAS